MNSDRRSVLGAGLTLSFLGATGLSAQTPPPSADGALPPGLPQPVETIDLWPQGAPGMPARALENALTPRSRATRGVSGR